MNGLSVSFMVLATLLWAGNYIVGGLASSAMSPLALTWWRWLLAAVPLIVIAVIVEKPRWRDVWSQLPRLALLSLLGMIGYNLFLYSALHFTSSVGASLINAANPATMAILAMILLKERVTARQGIGIAVSLIGVLVLLAGGSLTTFMTLHFNVGQLLMIVAILAWSLYSIWGRGIPRVGPITATAAQAVIAAVVLAPFAAVAGAPFPHESHTIAALLFIALLPSVGAYVLWNIALRTVAPAVAAIFLNLITVFTVLIGALIGQPLTLSEAFGGAVVIGGVVITSFAARRSPLRQRGLVGR